MSNLEHLKGAELKEAITKTSKELEVGKPIVEAHPGHECPALPNGLGMSDVFNKWYEKCHPELDQA